MQIVQIANMYYGLIRNNVGTDRPAMLRSRSRSRLLDLMFQNI